MYEVGETCKLKGNKKVSYTVLEIFFEEDGETLKGYHLLEDGVVNRWIVADRIAPRPRKKRKKGRK